MAATPTPTPTPTNVPTCEEPLLSPWLEVLLATSAVVVAGTELDLEITAAWEVDEDSTVSEDVGEALVVIVLKGIFVVLLDAVSSGCIQNW